MKIKLDHDYQDVQCDADEDCKKKKKMKEIEKEDVNDHSNNAIMASEMKKTKRCLSTDGSEIIEKRKKRSNNASHLENSNNKTTITEQFEQTVQQDCNENAKAELSQPVKESDDDESHQSNNAQEGTGHFSGKHLRTSLHSTDGLNMLKRFVKLCNENSERDITAEYLNAGGNILELLRLLSTTDKKGIGNVTIVFSAIRILLMKTLNEYPQYQSSAEQACRHLINSHLSLIHSMLSPQSNTKQRKIILQLLTAMVSLGGNLPRELLAHLSLQSQVIESLVRYTKPIDKQSIRTCFIHFVLAFLVEGNVPIIRALLDKRDFLTSIFPELIYDSKDTVNLVLTTVKTYVLENSGISKTMKLHVFSTSVIQNIVYLYNWKGPNNWPKNNTQNYSSSPEFFEEKEIVTDILHNFLTTLLTSYRHGIIFHDRTLGTSRTKHNNIVNTVLQSLDRPWEHEKPSDLVIKIMIACPDLIKSQLNLLEPYLEPRVSIKWITLMKFVSKIIESVDAEMCLKACSLELNTFPLADAVMALTVPGPILKNAIIPSLMHGNMIVRHQAILVLIVMFHQIQKFLSAVKIVFGENVDFDIFKNHTIEHITKNVPNIDMILTVWTNTFTPNASTENDDVPEPKRHEHLTAILNLLHAYNNISPELLRVTFNTNLNTLFDTLNHLVDIDINELNTTKVKAIQFLVALDPGEFSPHKKIFSSALSFLISLLNEKVTVSEYAKVSIKNLLSATGLFEGCSEELDIWINGFVSLHNSEQKEEITDWFINIVKKAARHTGKYINDIIETEEIVNEQTTVYYSGKLKDIIDELLEEGSVNHNSDKHKDSLHMQRLTSISPLLCCMLRKMKTDSTPTLLSYASYILLHTLHSQVTPQCLIHLATDIHELPIRKYLLSWSDSTQSVPIKKLFPAATIICKLDSALLAFAKIELNKIFSGETFLNFKRNDESITISHSLSEYDIINLFRMTIFYLIQFAKRATLTETQSENCKILLISLLYIAKDSGGRNMMAVHECSRFAFTHPILLQYFSPFCQENKDSIKNMLTTIIFEICSITDNLCEKGDVRNVFFHFKNKLVVELCKMLDKSRRCDKLNDIETIVTLLELIQLSAEDIVCLLGKLMKLESSMFVLKDKSDLSIYGYIVPKLMDIVSCENMNYKRTTFFKLDAEFVSHLCTHLLFLKSNYTINVRQWETALWKYLINFPFNVAAINASFFQSFLSTSITDATVQLISFLTSKNPKFIATFTDYTIKSGNIKERDIIFPVITSNLSFKWNQTFLQGLNKHYQSEIVSYLYDPKNTNTWIEESIEAICYLTENTFDIEVCEKISKAILQIGDKLDIVSINYVRLLQSLYKRYAMLKTEVEDPIMNSIQVFLHILTLTLKKESKNVKKLNVLCEELRNAVKHLSKSKSDFVFEYLCSNHSWPQFTRFSLKLGLKESKDDKSVPILKLLSALCDIAYKKDGDDEYVKTLFEMATSHSEFVNIMLGSSTTKRDIIELLWILMQKNKSVIALNHVPLYLSAYNATLSEADQFILFILQYYEENNINIQEYRPYLWGNAAAIHYSVKGGTDMALWRQPSTSQVLNLFERDIVNNTIKHYPIRRGLNNNELHEANDVYDPAFYLPLLCFLLSENNIVSCQKITHSGALAIAFAACGSSHSDVRMAAYIIISRYYTHLESSSSKAKLLWMRLIDALRYGIVSLKSELHTVRLNGFVSTFLAQTSLIASQPLNPLYSPLQTFLMAKPALDIKAIPEVLHLFHSSDVEHKTHRHWILEIIRDGMKTKNDVEIAFKYVLFKMILDFYTCNLCDLDSKKLILEVICNTTRITKGSIILMNGHGLLPWLFQVTKNFHIHDVQCIELTIKIVDNLLNAVFQTKAESIHYQFMLQILLSLKIHLSTYIKMSSFTLYVNALEKLLALKHLRIFVTKKDIEEILQVAKRLLGNMDECEDMLLYGVKYITIMSDVKIDDDVEIAKNSLKIMLRTWCHNETR